MKRERDSIDWQVVHRTHEGNPIKDENPDRQYWKEQLNCINQKLVNLEQVSLTDPVFSELKEKYGREKAAIVQQLDRLNSVAA